MRSRFPAAQAMKTAIGKRSLSPVAIALVWPVVHCFCETEVKPSSSPNKMNSRRQRSWLPLLGLFPLVLTRRPRQLTAL